MRLRGLEEKHALRRAIAPLVPREVWERRKVPYRAPIAEALAGESAPAWVEELLAPERIRAAGLLDSGAVARVREKLASRPGAASETDEMALVGSVSVMLLHDRLVARPARPRAGEAGRVVVGDRAVPTLEAAVA
jgi:asparagine synthase (glutamine-hydrolysing)